jgi:hypothetical protein
LRSALYDLGIDLKVQIGRASGERRANEQGRRCGVPQISKRVHRLRTMNPKLDDLRLNLLPPRPKGPRVNVDLFSRESIEFF